MTALSQVQDGIFPMEAVRYSSVEVCLDSRKFFKAKTIGFYPAPLTPVGSGAVMDTGK